jgi:hypothetical protein
MSDTDLFGGQAVKRQGTGGHQSARMESDVWLTPPFILHALGAFDLDPCAPADRPWDMAARHFTRKDNGLVQPWCGRVWCNPPYGREVDRWLRRLRQHGDGIALIFARTETEYFFDEIWPHADALLFIEGRLHFHKPDGRRAKTNAGAPSVLIAYGPRNCDALRAASEGAIRGQYIDLRLLRRAA